MTTIISHPGKPLIQHLREVARFCATTIRSKQYELCIDAKILEDLAFIEGAVHDIGKATKNFQKYIKSEGKTIIRPKHHALISAFLAKQIAIKYLADANVTELERELLPFFLFTSVKRHHGNMNNFDIELETIREKEKDLEILTNNFHEPEVQEILNELLAEINMQYDWDDFKVYMQELDDVIIEFEDFAIDDFPDGFKNISDSQKTEYFYIHQLFFSALLFSDKSDVKLSENKILKSADFNFDAINEYRGIKNWDKPSKDELSQLKNRAYLEGVENIRNIFEEEKHLYSITLPTGLGKTITSLAIAMEMKKILKQQNPRIVITIPFTSIIDQNYEVFNEIFNSPTSDVLLKHHHLAEPKYKTADDTVKEKDTENSKFLIETWQSEIVVTTFVQLIECLFTNDKGKLLKFPNLSNSIIILDEIQQIKYELWELIRAAFKVMGERFNCYFILMSATQPLIFEPEKEITEIIPNYQQYFNFFTRTTLINKTKSVISLDDFSKTIIEYHNDNADKDILIILNTKDITLKCFEQLKETIAEDEANLFFLTTLITPFERKVIIKQIKDSEEQTDRLPNIIVSTQLIEAGVDISVHTVFRAIAPLDSIIQAAGRANRRNKPVISEVFLYQIKELRNGTNTVYGADLILKTMNVLAEVETVNEANYLGLIQAYFKEVKKQSDGKVSKELEALQQLKFESLGKFEFVPDRHTESVYIQLNEKAKELWYQYEKIYRNEELNIFERREQFALIKAQFYDYVINVPVKTYESDHISFDNEPKLNFYVSELEHPSKCYDYDVDNFRKNTGYKPFIPHTLNL